MHQAQTEKEAYRTIFPGWARTAGPRQWPQLLQWHLSQQTHKWSRHEIPYDNFCI